MTIGEKIMAMCYSDKEEYAEHIKYLSENYALDLPERYRKLNEEDQEEALENLNEALKSYKCDLKENFKMDFTNITKNCLNKFRQDYGYKDGSYQKIWNGREDNVVAFEIANEWGADEELFEQLYRDLETYYKEEVLHKGEAPIFDKPDFFKCNELN